MPTQLYLYLETLATKEPRTRPQQRTPDVIIDCSRLPNPHSAYPALTGRDATVQQWLQQQPSVEPFLTTQYERLADALHASLVTGRHEVLAHIACPHGRHRSVAVAELLARRMLVGSQQWQQPVIIRLTFTSLRPMSIQ